MNQDQPATPLMTSTEAAAVLKIKPATLSNWRTTKRYPLPYVFVGRCVRYRRSDIEAFIASRLSGAQPQ